MTFVKTCLIEVATGVRFKKYTDTTTPSTFATKKISKNNKNYELELCDTWSKEKFRSLTKIFIKDSKIVVLVCDMTKKSSFEVKLLVWSS